jgi:hypothetical protein
VSIELHEPEPEDFAAKFELACEQTRQVLAPMLLLDDQQGERLTDAAVSRFPVDRPTKR